MWPNKVHAVSLCLGFLIYWTEILTLFHLWAASRVKTHKILKSSSYGRLQWDDIVDRFFFENTGSSPSPLICIAVWKVPISLPFPQFSSASFIKCLFYGSSVTLTLACPLCWCFRISHVHLKFTFPRREGKPLSVSRSVYANSIEMI